MFIIWGSRNFNKNYGTKGNKCPYCNDTVFTFFRTMKWFSLFFIPLFPYYIYYSKICNSCGHRKVLDKKHFFDELNEPIKPEIDIFNESNKLDETLKIEANQHVKEIKMREIFIQRKKRFVGCRMKVNIHIDNSIAAVLKNGQNARVTIDTNNHNIFATAGSYQYMLRSNIIQLDNSDENKFFNVNVGMNLKLIPQESE